MGNTWEVWAWLEDVDAFTGYAFKQIYGGESRRVAMRKARDAKLAGCGCVKIEWRGMLDAGSER